MTNVALLRLRDDVLAASAAVAPSWPLSSAVAVNPLQGFEALPFEQALERAEALFGARGTLDLTEYRLLHLAGRIDDGQLRAALLDQVHDLGRGEGEPSAQELDLLVIDLLHGPDDAPPARTTITVAEEHDRRWGSALRAAVDAASAERCLQRYGHDGPAPAPRAGTDQAVLDALDALRVPAWAQRRYLEASIAALPGWVAHVRWRERREDVAPGDLVLDVLAHRVATEVEAVAGRAWFHADGPRPRRAEVALGARVDAVVRHAGVDRAVAAAALERLPGWARRLVWLDAHERSVHDPLLLALGGAQPAAAEPSSPQAQLVACIDVRSEPLRRHLEQVGRYETFGFAGFFGLPVHLQPAGGGRGSDRLPVLLDAQVTVEDRAAGDPAHRAEAGAQDAWSAAKVHPMAPLALAEGAGWIAGPLAAARTLAPGWTAEAIDRLRPTSPCRTDDLDRSSVPVTTQAAWVAGILRLLLPAEGATTARLVVLCGHGARTDNNPYESALACGACGGNPGGSNARLAAAAANDPSVRAELARTGRTIDADTWFVAAEHDTATDTVVLLDTDEVPDSHRTDLAVLAADLDEAGRRAALERGATLPGAPTSVGEVRLLGRTRRRSRDWAEPAAELGLAGNAAFIVGPRSLTAGIDLGRRSFLHSYDAAGDPDGSLVAGILTAPLVVAQWISTCYHFSATDPEVFGAGSKALHNVVADIGVLIGGGGDLRRGLPRQSVRDGDRLLHEPVRLLAIVQARLDHIDAAIAGSPTLQQFVHHGWIHLVARASAAEPWQQRTAAGWRPRPLARTAGDHLLGETA